MIVAKTNSGFEINLNEDLMDDAELLEDILAVEHDPAALFRVSNKILTAEEKKKLYEQLRAEDGRVPLSAFGAAVGELLQSFTAGKNSLSSPN